MSISLWYSGHVFGMGKDTSRQAILESKGASSVLFWALLFREAQALSLGYASSQKSDSISIILLKKYGYLRSNLRGSKRTLFPPATELISCRFI
ncbi:hypothetical protein Y1Q_0011667 [Alligator mississippiensis]|uniref:Uncharacterized protein n=1 Tax=Alligator mississippiensis TaxID=8496 RepID=A0A151M0P5_ALLMI|nr:hypothetical protein Y1Q_0011667 [Alligator mississippiensis]